jgi:hypothetical protein
MILYTAHDLVFIVAASMTLLGVIAIGAGIVLLVTRASGKAVQTLATQATHLAQKGMAENIAGLVGNASSLVQALNQLILTNAGIGLFLVIFGFIMLIAAFLMVKFF